MDAKIIIFWVWLLAMAAPTFYFGLTKLINQKDKRELFIRLGYPLWFMKWIGLGEVSCAIGLLFSVTRMPAIGVLSVILVGAAFSHWRVKDGLQQTMTPVYVLVHLIVILVFAFLL